MRQQPVEVGYQNQDIAVISKGLQGGQNVVLAGQSRLANEHIALR